MPTTVGSHLGPYQILSAIGSGGMGEVYKALDTRLDRTVAIKVLLTERTGGADQKQRFLHEARAASALNHPSIITIYDIGSENGVDYIAMECVAGKTLDLLIPRNGMRFGELLRYAVQATDALAKAHQAGIIHRDLKPSNIMVTTDGLVKVLDFGLAKQLPVSSREVDSTQTPLTGERIVVGTAQYMSPEQAEGKAVDARSDIFSFGAMLYEMATGQRAFQGDSQIAVLSSILRDDPKSPGSLRTDMPPELARIINRCLRKDPARRFQHMADLKVALQELKEESDSGLLSVPIQHKAQKSLPRATWWSGVVALLIVATFVAWHFATSRAAKETIFSPSPITSYPGHEDDATFSPDGNQIAFIWNGEKGDNYDIYVKLIGPGAALRLTTDPAQDAAPRWSPDGSMIAFVRMEESVRDQFSVYVVPALGGTERRVGNFLNRAVSVGLQLPSLCWTKDSKALIISAAASPSTPNRLLLVSLDGSYVRPLTNPPNNLLGDTRPALSDGSNNLAFIRTNASTAEAYVMPLSAMLEPGGDPRKLAISDPFVTNIEWMPGGRDLIFAAGAYYTSSGLYRISVQPGSQEHSIPGIGPGSSSPAVAAQGTRLAFTTGTQDVNFWSVDLINKTAEIDRSLSSSFRDVFPQYSPDGKRIAFYSSRNGSVQIWVANSDGTQAAPVTSMSGPVTASPRWSPDGKQIAFDSNTGGEYQAYVISVDGGQPRLVASDRPSFAPNWSHDGRWIYFASKRTGEYQIWKIPAIGGVPVQVTNGGGIGPAESPDGKSVYFTKENGSGGLWNVPIAGGKETQILPNVYRYNYAITDKGIYFTPNSKHNTTVQYLDFATNEISTIVTTPYPIDLGLTVSPDRKKALYSQADYIGYHLMLVENFQ